MAYKAVIIGASGLIGSELLNILLNEQEYGAVLVLVRKELPLKHKKLLQQVVDFDKLEGYSGLINGHAIFSCLGTTNKNTPDKAQYRKIDHDYPVKLAEIALKNGMGQFHLVTAVGADASASNFYLKTKGEVEEDVKKVGLKNVNIYQPSFLTGNRKEYRLPERIIAPIMSLIDLFLLGKAKKFRSISAHDVAMAMFKQSINNLEGNFTLTYEQIKQLT